MKIVLAFPAEKKHLADHSTGLLPLGLLSMASCLEREGHEVRVIHLAQYRRKDWVPLLLDPKPDVVGLSCFTFHRHGVLALATSLRQAAPGGHPAILLGGPHAAPLAREILQQVPAVDAVSIGEGERTVVEVASRLARGASLAGVPGLATRGDGPEGPPPACTLEDLDELPPSTDWRFPILGVSLPYQLRHLTASRGCAAGCTFCRAPEAWGHRVRRRSVASFLQEIASLREGGGAVFLSLRDDTFTADRAWVQAFCQGLIERGSDIQWDCQTRVSALDGETADLMRRAGCVQVQIGLESGSERIIRQLRKPFTLAQAEQAVAACRAAGLLVSLYLIYGVPGETADDLKKTEALVRRARPSSVSVARLCIYPGTPLAAGVSPQTWFEEKGEDLHAWRDAAAVRHGERLQALEQGVRKGKPYGVADLRAVADRVDGPFPRLALAEGLSGAGQRDEAEKVYRDLVRVWPGFVWGETGLGDLLLDGGRAAEAEGHFRRARDRAAAWWYPLDRLGGCLRRQGRDREGQALIDEAARLMQGAPGG